MDLERYLNTSADDLEKLFKDGDDEAFKREFGELLTITRPTPELKASNQAAMGKKPTNTKRAAQVQASVADNEARMARLAKLRQATLGLGGEDMLGALLGDDD